MMKQAIVTDEAMRKAARQGVDAFVRVVVDAIYEAVGGELTQDALPQLNADQMTLLVWNTVHEEVMDGGFVQLIHNGYGPFVFKNPFAKAVKQWGMRDLSKLIYAAHTLYEKHKTEIEKDCSDEAFMALFEQYPDFDELDDSFVEHEEEWTEQIAQYIDAHMEQFVIVK